MTADPKWHQEEKRVERMKDQAREAAQAIGTEHGSNAASWVELDEETAEAITHDGGVFGVFDLGSPLSGEWADGYSVEQLYKDCGAEDTGEFQHEDELVTVYEEAYWQAFEYEVERKVETLREGQ